MSVGAMNKFVTFKKNVQSRTDAAAVEYTLENVTGLVRTPCSYRPDRGYERTREDRIESAEQGVIKVWSFAASRGLTAANLGTLHDTNGDRDFKILHIDNRDQNDVHLNITVEFGTTKN